jgi:Fe-S cluster assembly protein SufD
VALNTALAMHGVFVHVKKGKAIERPILMLHVADARQASPLAQPRHLIIAEENSQVTVVERYVSLGKSTAVVNSVTEVSVAPYAVVDHYSIQEEGEAVSHIGLLQAKQGNNSHFSNTAIFLGDGMVRKNLNISLDGQHSEGYMNGLYLLGNRAHVDNHTMVDHRVPNCYSNELYKGVLDGQSRGVFNGKIFVRQDAQKTNAFQSNNNILLSDKAVVDTKPQLEIWADDVKCSHGATVGTLNEEPMFYLRSRGIPEAKAKALLTFAFAADVLERIKLAPLKAYIATEIAKRLGYEQI